MFEKLELFRMSSAMAAHASARQELVSRNIANADTPGYKARDLPSFARLMQRVEEPVALRTSRAAHMAEAGSMLSQSAIPTDDEPSPNGNSVSLESEMVRAAEIRQEHDMALAVYSASLNILRTSLGRK